MEDVVNSYLYSYCSGECGQDYWRSWPILKITFKRIIIGGWHYEEHRLDRQKVEVAKRVAQADIVITTALIPGRPAPVLVSEDMVKAMKPGAVIVDLAAPQGGNCPLTEAGKTVIKHGVTLVGETNLPALVAADASALYARNVLDFLKLVITKEGTFNVPMDDDIVAACLMTQAGEIKRK